MADRAALLAEASRRGILTPELQAEYDRMKASGQIPPSSSTKAGNTAFDNTTNLRKEFESRPAVQAYNTVLPQIATAMKLASRGQTGGADDLNIIYTFGKVMDPGSVVREGELDLASNTGSAAQGVQGWISKIQSGQRLPPEVRRSLVESMRQRGIELAHAYNQTRDQYKSMATRAGFSPDDVVGPHPAAPYAQVEANFIGQPIKDRNNDKVIAEPKGITIGGIIDNLPPDQGGPPSITSDPSDQKFYTDADKKVTGILQSAFNRGASREEIDGILKEYGRPTFGPELDAAIKARDNGTKGIRFNATPSGQRDPTTMQKAIGPIAASPIGIGAIGAANGVTGGLLDEGAGAIDSLVTGRPYAEATADFDLKKHLAERANSTAYGIGQFGGQALGMVGAGKLAGVGKIAAEEGTVAAPQVVGAFAPRAIAADSAFGGLSGAGENNDNRLLGAGEGAVLAGAGGALGRGVINTAGTLVAPNVGDDVRFLRDRGVRTTIGQNLGRAASDREEKLMSNATAGPSIRSAWDRADSDFNTGFLNDSLKPIGAKLPDGHTGTKAMGFAQQAFNNAYDAARAKMKLVPDAQLGQDLTDLSAKLGSGQVSEDVAARVTKIANTQIADRIKAAGGSLDGGTYKQVTSQIGKMADQAKRSQNFELSDSLGDLKSIVDNAARRSSPDDAVAALDAADQGYALFVRAEKAAALRGGDTGTFTPNQLDRAVQSSDSSVRSKAYLRGDALGQDWADAGKNVLNKRIPNSATTDRAQLSDPLQWPKIAASSPLLLPYMASTRDIASALTGRASGPKAKAFADALTNRSYLGGATLSPLLLPYASGTQ